MKTAIATQDVFSRMYTCVDNHNAAQSQVRYTIRLGKLKTLDTLVTKYVDVLRKFLKSSLAIDADELPPLYTNRAELARLTKCGQRTIYDHLEALEAAGLIFRVFRGRQHDFTVWINPWIMLEEGFSAPALVDLSTARNPGFSPYIRQISPLQSTLEGSNNTPNSGVDLVENVKNGFLATVPPNPQGVGDDVRRRLERETAPHPPLAAREGSLDRGPGGRGAGLDLPSLSTLLPRSGADDKGDVQAGRGVGRLGNARPTASRPQKPTPELDQTSREGASADHERDRQTREGQIKLTRAFWKLARETFWEDEYISPDHERKILNLIWADVLFGSTRCSTDASSRQLYNQRIKQLELAKKYTKKAGWDSVMPALAYFSREHYKKQLAEGTKGNFHHTTAWMLANEKQAAVVQMERLIDKAIGSVLNLRAPYRPWKGPKTTIALYAYWEDRLKSAVPDVLRRDRFHAAVLAVTGQLSTPFSPQ